MTSKPDGVRPIPIQSIIGRTEWNPGDSVRGLALDVPQNWAESSDLVPYYLVYNELVSHE